GRGSGHPGRPAGVRLRALHPGRAPGRRWRYRPGTGHRAVGDGAARREHRRDRLDGSGLPDPGEPARSGRVPPDRTGVVLTLAPAKEQPVPPAPPPPPPNGVYPRHWPGPERPASRPALVGSALAALTAAGAWVVGRPGLGWLVTGLVVAGAA